MRNYFTGFIDKWNALSFPVRSVVLLSVSYVVWYLVETYLPEVMSVFLNSSPVEWFTRLHSDLFGVLFPSLLPFSIEQDGTLFRLENGALLRIIWGCTGLKVGFVFLVGQLLCYKPSRRLLMLVVYTLVIVFVLNLLRVYLTFLAYHDMPNNGVLVHDLLGKALYVLTYLFWFIYDGNISKKTDSIAAN